ncbi:MAG: transposase zinc-binding domain-containing protein [Pseudomonadales bacterium]|nr:transposase zinc-binding domain-containing protein [Pseudomonadales bacterium]
MEQTLSGVSCLRRRQVPEARPLRRLAHCFIRVTCDGCRHEHLLAFPCKRRGVCPSCGAPDLVRYSLHWPN